MWVNTDPKSVKEGSDILSIFFVMWREEHPDAELQDVPCDMVTASASGLDPHISLLNAEFQLDRVAAKWAADLKRAPTAIRKEIERIFQQKTSAPFNGLAGENLSMYSKSITSYANFLVRHHSLTRLMEDQWIVAR